MIHHRPPEGPTPQIPEYYLEGYNPCAICTHYRPEVDSEGFGVPYKGRCASGTSNKGALSLISTSAHETYNFLSCNEFTANPNLHGARVERSPQLYVFADVNPMIEPVALRYSFYRRLPKAYQPNPLTQEQLAVLENVDLVTLLQSRADDVDTISFIKEGNFQSVPRHFALSLKANSKVETAHWSRFAHYADLGASIYEEGEQKAPTDDLPPA